MDDLDCITTTYLILRQKSPTKSYRWKNVLREQDLPLEKCTNTKNCDNKKNIQ